MTVAVLIPALNEERSIGRVLSDIPRDVVDRIVVVDNGSTDSTASIARSAGAVVVSETERGYGAACQRGLAFLADDPPDVVVFLDGDYSDHPDELPMVVRPILTGDADLVIGSRTAGASERGALLPQARVGNALACFLIRLFWNTRYTDLGPFRAVSWDSLTALDMQDRGYGWTVEMQIKAARRGFRVVEVPVSYRKRIGQSKISGTVSGSVKAGAWILWTIGRHAVSNN